MALLVWLWVERNGGGVIPGQAPPPEQSYQDPVPAPFGGLDRIEMEIGVAIRIPISGMMHPNRLG